MGLRGQGLVPGGFPIPGQQLVHPIVRQIGDAGKHIGEPRNTEAVWIDDLLNVEDKPMAKLARTIAQELGRPFNRPDIVDAIMMCTDRPLEFIRAYMEEDFELGPYAQATPSKYAVNLDPLPSDDPRPANPPGGLAR